MLPSLLWQRLLMMSHYRPIAGHPSQCRMYETLRATFSWLLIAAKVDYIVQNCASCTRTNQNYRHRRNIQLFSAGGQLEFVAMVFVGPFPIAVQGNQHILVIKSRCSRLTRAVLILRMIATHIANMSMYHWLIPYCIPTYLLPDNDT